MNAFKTIAVSILGKEYQVNCPIDDSDALNEAVLYLNKKMNETKKNSSTLGIDRIAIMTALNLANDLLKKNAQLDEVTIERDELNNQLRNQNNIIESVSDKIENVMGEFEKRNPQ